MTSSLKIMNVDTKMQVCKCCKSTQQIRECLGCDDVICVNCRDITVCLKCKITDRDPQHKINGIDFDCLRCRLLVGEWNALCNEVALKIDKINDKLV